MNIITNEKLEHIVNDFSSALKIHYESTPFSFYQEMKIPYMIIKLANHPDVEQSSNVWTMLTPDFKYDASLSRDLMPTKNIMHQHNYFEFMYVVKGNVYQIIEEKRFLYTPGSCCLLNRNTRHTEEHTTDYQVIFFCVSVNFIERLLNFGKSFLFQTEKGESTNLVTKFLENNIDPNRENKKDYIDFIPASSEIDQKEKILNIFEQMAITLLSPEYGSTFKLLNLFCQFASILSNPEYYHSAYINTKTKIDSLIFARISHLLEDSKGRLPRLELEALLNYDGSYLGRIVKKNTGMTLFDYSMTFCLSAAEDLLRNTKKSISEIASDLNFTNRTHFYKLFQAKNGMTPKEYRNTH